MAGYTTAAEVRAQITDSDFTSDSSHDELLAAYITAASRLIDRYVGGHENFFAAGDKEQTRYFDGSGERVLDIDWMVNITAVEINDEPFTDFLAWPYNAPPVKRLDRKGRWPRTRIKVTGVFGYSEQPPATIAMACKIQTMRWFMRAKGGFEDSQASAAVGQMFYTQDIDPDVKLLLEAYRIETTAL